MENLKEKLEWSKELIEKVICDYKPYATIVGLTTGGDSLAAFHVTRMLGIKTDACFTCNTTIAAPETLLNCQNVCDRYNSKWICKAPPYGGLEENHNTNFELVKQHGFPGKTKTAHNWMYRYLKDHTIEKIITSIRQRKRNRPIVIISGSRKHESVRRVGTSKDITIRKGVIWVNILNEWTDSETAAFKREHNIDDERSIISKTIGLSGECFCGCFAQKGELTEIKSVSPSTYEKIMMIDSWLKNNTNMLWEWEEEPPASWALEKNGQLNMFSPQLLMCSTCMNNTKTLIP